MPSESGKLTRQLAQDDYRCVVLSPVHGRLCNVNVVARVAPTSFMRLLRCKRLYTQIRSERLQISTMSTSRELDRCIYRLPPTTLGCRRVTKLKLNACLFTRAKMEQVALSCSLYVQTISTATCACWGQL